MTNGKNAKSQVWQEKKKELLTCVSHKKSTGWWLRKKEIVNFRTLKCTSFV